MGSNKRARETAGLIWYILWCLTVVGSVWFHLLLVASIYMIGFCTWFHCFLKSVLNFTFYRVCYTRTFWRGKSFSLSPCEVPSCLFQWYISLLICHIASATDHFFLVYIPCSVEFWNHWSLVQLSPKTTPSQGHYITGPINFAGTSCSINPSPPSGFSRLVVVPILLRSCFSPHLRLSHRLTNRILLCSNGSTRVICWFCCSASVQPGVKCQSLHAFSSLIWLGWRKKGTL